MADLARRNLHVDAAAGALRRNLQRQPIRERRSDQAIRPLSEARERSQNGIAISRLRRKRTAALGRSRDASFFAVLVPRDRLVWHGAGRCAGNSAEESSATSGVDSSGEAAREGIS